MAQWCHRIKNHTKQSLVVDASASPWRRAWGSLTPKYDNSAYSHSHRDENELRQKRWFFGKNAHLQSSIVQLIGRTESDGHAASILALIELCTASFRGLYSKFFSKKCVKCSSFENDGELMLMVVQAHSEQQQQCFRLTLLNEHVNELLYPRIQFTEFASQIDPQTALKVFFSTKFST